MPHISPLALTMGEPSGIGGELTLKVWLDRETNQCPPFVAFDDPERLRLLSEILELSVPVHVIENIDDLSGRLFEEALPIYRVALKVPSQAGSPTPDNASAVINSIDQSVNAVMTGALGAVVTNPIQKSTLYEAGFDEPGHTEYLAKLAGGNAVSIMMLAGPELRTVPVTVHEALKCAVMNLTTEAIIRAGRIVDAALKNDFSITAPVIAVAGLNPHAGESGALGKEDIEMIRPAIEQLISDGIDARGPMPSDTMFSAGPRNHYDVALCMYHDQALIPVKTLDIDNTVNVTLGLPFVRTSPDHGTALDIAGTGKANPASLLAALKLAADMAARRLGTS